MPEKCESPYDELAILERLNHENIILLLNYIDSKRRLTLIFEIAEKGDLFQLLKERGPVSEIQTASIINDIGHALFYLQTENIIHRNIKLENILVFKITHYHIDTKLADFSLAVKAVNPISTVCGSINYISPEMAERKDYIYPVDLWALGVVCYILLSALPPFHSTDGDKEEVLERIRNGDYSFPVKFWSNISNECKQLIDSLLHQDPNKRLTTSDLLCHRWIIANGNKSEFNTPETDYHIMKRRNELSHKPMDENINGITMTKPKSNTCLNSIKSFFKGSLVCNEPIKPFLGSNNVQLKSRLIKLPSNQTDANSLFD